MRLMVVAPMYWLDEKMADARAWLYLASCRSAGIANDVRRVYGIGCTAYQGETVMRITGLVEYLSTHAGDFTHVLFTDAWDVLFARSLQEIQKKYDMLGRPSFLHAGSIQRANVCINDYDHLFTTSTPWRFLGGGFIAEIPIVLDLFPRMDVRNTHDQSTAYFEAWREGWFKPQIDVNCEIFQSVEINGDEDYCEIVNGYAFNTWTRTWPCVLHFGGRVFVDPVTGKDRIIEPWARQLGII